MINQRVPSFDKSSRPHGTRRRHESSRPRDNQRRKSQVKLAELDVADEAAGSVNPTALDVAAVNLSGT